MSKDSKNQSIFGRVHRQCYNCAKGYRCVLQLDLGAEDTLYKPPSHGLLALLRKCDRLSCVAPNTRPSSSRRLTTQSMLCAHTGPRLAGTCLLLLPLAPAAFLNQFE